MAVITPPLALQGGAILHDAALFRRAYQGLLINDNEGIGRFNGTSDLAVSQNSPTGMSVLVARGGCYVKGDQATDQGVYFCYNDGNTVVTIAAADLVNPRIDLIVAEVRDNFHGSAGDDWRLRSVTGTPSGSPVAPATPASCLVLAHVAVAANATTITNANVTDKRAPISPIGGTFICTSTTRPATPWNGLVIYETDTDKLLIYDGANWLLPDNVAGGYMTRASFASAVGITTGTDLSAQPTVTVPAGRRIKITVILSVQQASGSGLISAKLFEGGTQLGASRAAPPTTISGFYTLTLIQDLAPSAGNHTYKINLATSGGSVNVDADSADRPSYWLIEDIGVAA